MQNHFIVSLFLITIFIIPSCSDNEMCFSEDKCLPQIIEGKIGNSLLNKNEFFYSNGKLINYDDKVIVYDGDRVVEILSGSTEIEEYTYDDNDRIVSSSRHEIDIQTGEKKVVEMFEFTYKGEYVHKLLEKVENTEYFYFRTNDSSNVDSVHTYRNGGLHNRHYYKYDTHPNVYTNLCSPLFGIRWCIVNKTENNIIQSDGYGPTASSYAGSTREIIYNSQMYPIEITNTLSSGTIVVTKLDYINCE